jgi:hypothetical protein
MVGIVEYFNDIFSRIKVFVDASTKHLQIILCGSASEFQHPLFAGGVNTL